MPPPNGLFAAVSVASLAGAMHARGAREAVGSRMQHLLPLAGLVQRSLLILPVSAVRIARDSQDAPQLAVERRGLVVLPQCRLAAPPSGTARRSLRQGARVKARSLPRGSCLFDGRG